MAVSLKKLTDWTQPHATPKRLEAEKIEKIKFFEQCLKDEYEQISTYRRRKAEEMHTERIAEYARLISASLRRIETFYDAIQTLNAE